MKKLNAAELTEFGTVFVNSAGIQYDLSKAEVVDVTDAKDIADASANIRTISQGLTLLQDQEFKVVKVIKVPVTNKIETPEDFPFKTPDKSKAGIYAVLDINGRRVKAKVEALITPIILTGVEEGSDVHKRLRTAMEDAKSLPQTGSLSDLATLIGKDLKVTHSIMNYERVVKGTSGPASIKVSSFRFKLA